MALCALAALLVVVAAACGDDGTAGATESGADAVVVEHAFGSTTVDGVPRRIVSIGAQWTGILLAMDVQPVGHMAEPSAGPQGLYPWEEGLSTEVEYLDGTGGLPIEQIAALDPDLILVTHMASEQADFDRLAVVAPTIGLLGGRQVDTWQDMTEVLGRVLREEDRAAEVIDGVEQLVADTRAELPGLEGKSYTLANYVPGDAIYVVADPEDGAGLFFQGLGMQVDPEILEVADGVSGRAQFSLEQAGLLDSDLLLLLANDGDPEDLVGYDQLPAVQSGAVAVIDFATAVGLNTPSPVSLPYSLEQIRPALEAANNG